MDQAGSGKHHHLDRPLKSPQSLSRPRPGIMVEIIGERVIPAAAQIEVQTSPAG